MPKRKREVPVLFDEIWAIILHILSSYANILRLRLVCKNFNNQINRLFKPTLNWRPSQPLNTHSVEVLHWHHEGIFHQHGRDPLPVYSIGRAIVGLNGVFFNTSRQHGFYNAKLVPVFEHFKCSKVTDYNKIYGTELINIFALGGEKWGILSLFPQVSRFVCITNPNQTVINFGVGNTYSNGRSLANTQQRVDPSRFTFGFMDSNGIRQIVFTTGRSGFTFVCSEGGMYIGRHHSLPLVSVLVIMGSRIVLALAKKSNKEQRLYVCRFTPPETGQAIVTEEEIEVPSTITSIALFRNFAICFDSVEKSVRIMMLTLDQNQNVVKHWGRVIWRCRFNAVADRPYMTLSNYGFTLDLSNKRIFGHFKNPLIIQ